MSYLSGTKEERGIVAWQSITPTKQAESEHMTKQSIYDEGLEIYDPLLPERFKRHWILKYVPFLPNPESDEKRSCRDGCHDDVYNDSYL